MNIAGINIEEVSSPPMDLASPSRIGAPISILRKRSDPCISCKTTDCVLHTIRVFQALSPTHLKLICDSAIKRKYKRGEAVVQTGGRSNYLYVVLSGSVKVINIDEQGREVILAILNNTDVFGEMSIIDDSPHSATVIAREDSLVMLMPKSTFRQIVASDSGLMLEIVKTVTNRLRFADQQILSLALLDVYGRVARILLDHAEIVDDLRVVRIGLTQVDISKMVGASREMVNKVMKDLEDRGYIEVGKDFIILHEKYL
jgi:CRP/FNR family cyclic AMP-dependent transcriptional regulator